MGGLGLARKRDWETTFSAWAQPPSPTEQERCERAVSAIKNAIAQSAKLARRSITVFPQGSYANRVNVRQDSDADVCILCADTFFHDMPPGVPWRRMGGPVVYPYSQYKDEIGEALTAYFGRGRVKRGSKAFDIHENTYRVDADAVACFDYYQYYYSGLSMPKLDGTALIPDDNPRLVTNFPALQYENGVTKNTRTDRRFKALVRIVKSLRNEMSENGYAVADPIASFLIESLIWNFPDIAFFGHKDYQARVRAALAWIAVNTQAERTCADWTEVNGIKKLFGPHNKWTRQQVGEFALTAHHYILGIA